MLAKRVLPRIPTRCSSYSTRAAFKPIPTLPNADLETFRNNAFMPASPALLPQGTFKKLPAVQEWFTTTTTTTGLNTTYLARFGACHVPLELSHADQFVRITQPLSYFLACVTASTSTYLTTPTRYFSAYVPNARAPRRKPLANDTFFSPAPPTAKIYLAQAPLADLPQALRDDVPVPELVMKAGRGDVYDSSIWLGMAPTYTPLHRDPNPNLFVQLAGRKTVRLYTPEVGRAIFGAVQERIGGRASASMRGEEMMQGVEKRALEEQVWGGDDESGRAGWEAELGAGDGLFIPKGWWHSIKGTGEGMTGSVNWWFR